jgi:hypothetical protein
LAGGERDVTIGFAPDAVIVGGVAPDGASPESIYCVTASRVPRAAPPWLRLNPCHETGGRPLSAYIPVGEFAMFKAIVVAFALTVSGFMLWVAHHDAHYATTHQVAIRQPV